MQILANRKFATSALVVLVLNCMAMVVFADSSSMATMAGSAEMRGTTEFYYSNEWLVRFVQFVISWLCIIALLVYYAGWLCSMVVLSNKEIFYLIDTIKKEASESGNGDDKGFSGITAVLHSFKNGSKDGVNGGLDNFVLFILSLSINFKAYSYYKDVEAGSDGGDGAGGSQFNYNDTMLNFILKTAIPAVTVTFVCSVAISGVLLQCWFVVSDVFIVRAERFANTNLSAKVDQWIGDSAGYTFTLNNTGHRLSEQANDVAKSIYSQVAANYPGATEAHLQQLGIEIEKQVSDKLLGKSTDGYDKTSTLLANFTPDGKSPTIQNESQARYATMKLHTTTNVDVIPTESKDISFEMHNLLGEAGIAAEDDKGVKKRNVYFYVTYKWDAAGAGTAVTSGKATNSNTGANGAVTQ